MKLVDVYETPEAVDVLWELLVERDASVNISHKEPSWEKHVAFVRSKPYSAWYLIVAGPETVGAIYLSNLDEIGVFILRRHQGKGHGPRAIGAIIRKHKRDRYLANISPRNARSIRLFEKLGFCLIQQTYERTST